MTKRYQRRTLLSQWTRGMAVSAGAFVVLSTFVAMAQEPKPAPPASEASRPAPSGLLDAVGRWFEDSITRFNANLGNARGTVTDMGDRASGAAKSAADAAKGAVDAASDAAKGAADTVGRLPMARVVDGRARCAVAPNGAPDCRTAAETVCRGKGFASGTSLDIQSAQKCPARIWLSGRAPEARECDVESFVTRAMCQ